MIGHASIGSVPIGGIISDGVRNVAFSDVVETRQQEFLQPWPWLEFYDVLTDGSGTLRYVDFQDPDARGTLANLVPFNGNEYEARKIKRGAIADSTDGPARFAIEIEDPKGALIATTNTESGLVDAKVTITLIPYDLLSQPTLGTSETYRVRSSRFTMSPDRVVLEVGLPSLSDIDIPSIQFSRTRCFNDYHRRFELDSYCTAPSDEFQNGTSQVFGSDDSFALVPGTWPAAAVKRRFGWSTVNADIATTWKTSTTVVIGFTGEFWTLASSIIANQRWWNADQKGMFQWKDISGDFVYESHVVDSGVRTEYTIGLMVQDFTAAANWIRWGKIRDSVGVEKIEKTVTESGVSTASASTALADGDERFRIQRVGTTFTLFVKPSDSGAWVQKHSDVVSSLSGSKLRVGLAVSSMDTVSTNNLSAKFRFFRVTAGGFPTCDRSLSDCLERENVHQFNGFPALPNQRTRG